MIKAQSFECLVNYIPLDTGSTADVINYKY